MAKLNNPTRKADYSGLKPASDSGCKKNYEMTNNTPYPNNGKPSHNRKSIRLKKYDYSQAGMYFVTICCGGRECRFAPIYYNAKLYSWYYRIG